MNTKKILTVFLAVLMLVSSLSVGVYAKESAVESTDEFYTYYTDEYTSQKARADAMKLEYSNDTFNMYMDEKTGEFALENKKTGEYIFSNPYDLNVNTSITTDLAKNALLSQVLVEYTDTTTGTGAFLSSFGSAAVDGQINVIPQKDGVRVEYAIGTVETKRLIPIRIEATRFETMILSVLEAASSRMTEAEKTIYNKMATDVYYKKYDQTDDANAIMVDVWRSSYSCLETNHEMIIYVFQGTERSKSQVEKLIRKYCPAYTYDELEYDHELTEYEAQEKELPLFRLAIEYTFDDTGITATIPAKSIRYNSTNYSLANIVLLPYIGCTSVKTSGDISRTGGYIFIPDGSGTLLEYYSDDGSVNVGTQSTGVIYGLDYSKETLQEGSAHAETAKVPVFGLVDDYEVTYTSKRTNRPDKVEVVPYSRGFAAIITEGETFANIVANLGEMAWSNLATTSMEYNTVYASFSATQGDTVSMGGTFGNGSEMSTTIDTKYTGNYSVKYIMLTDESKADAAGKGYYESSYVGMANAYRDYLIETGTLDKLAASEIESGIPLYIESFGAIKSKKTFLTFPVTVTTPLTTFDDVQAMMEYLIDAGITNQRFVLTGFGNGTMTKTYYPTYSKWESKLGGNHGFKNLLKYADQKGISLFPNYDFMNVTSYKPGFTMRRYAAKTMSGRYAKFREYDPVFQFFSKMATANIVSSGSLEDLYAKFIRSYNKYKVGALAVKTIGNQLDSDFDDEAPITREDAKDYVLRVLEAMKEDNGSLLLSAGNAYTYKYATDVIELPLDNSGYAISSYSVPFIGIVLHGYMNYAGDAINMSGDTKYAILKSLENGAGLYFILSYRNTDLVKTSTISQYYSMMFDTWQSEVVEYYNMLNGAIGNLQNATITAHSFATAYRMDSDIAAVMFGFYDDAKEKYAAAQAEYASAVAAVDVLIKNQQNADSAVAKETAATDALNAARTQLAYANNLLKRYNTDDVVSVTYTSDNGVSKTFYINYNTYDVVVENENGEVFVIGPESFVCLSDIKPAGKIVKQSTDAMAFTATTKQKENFTKAYSEYVSAVADGNETLVIRKQATVENAISAMTPVQNVKTGVSADGRTVVINYNSAAVIVKTGENEYREIASQSFIVLDN
ncbi:MAG: hypothetical protein KBS59_03700 [Clostridiales bacterium]|nr:hypothetical protein [Clostridiales bacterium]